MTLLSSSFPFLSWFKINLACPLLGGIVSPLRLQKCEFEKIKGEYKAKNKNFYYFFLFHATIYLSSFFFSLWKKKYLSLSLIT